MDFRPLKEAERRDLIQALRGNADRGLAILMDRRTTGFAGTADRCALSRISSGPAIARIRVRSRRGSIPIQIVCIGRWLLGRNHFADVHRRGEIGHRHQ